MGLITKIISGGQVGADIAALRAGRALGIETGGWMPQGFRALDGEHPEYAQAYGVREHECRGYPPRTRLNVQESDATVRFAVNFNSPGERCTLNAIQEFGKPYFDLAIPQASFRVSSVQRAEFGIWLDQQPNLSVLNVAGNGLEWIEAVVERTLITVIGNHNARYAEMDEEYVEDEDHPF